MNEYFPGSVEVVSIQREIVAKDEAEYTPLVNKILQRHQSVQVNEDLAS